MCRGKRAFCTKLGSAASDWPTNAPLMPPALFEAQLTAFEEAVRLAALGDVPGARTQLRSIQGEELQKWFIEHGQQSGVFRNRHFGRAKPAVTVPLDPVKIPDRYANKVFVRDGYRCRYCGIRLVPKDVLMAFSNVVGQDFFRPTGKNLDRHGIVLMFRANADHVLPWTLGGRTDMDNLVSACWCCNFGKSDFTLGQLGVDDPRLRQIPSSNGWDGLTSHLAGVRAVARRPT